MKILLFFLPWFQVFSIRHWLIIKCFFNYTANLLPCFIVFFQQLIIFDQEKYGPRLSKFFKYPIICGSLIHKDVINNSMLHPIEYL